MCLTWAAESLALARARKSLSPLTVSTRRETIQLSRGRAVCSTTSMARTPLSPLGTKLEGLAITMGLHRRHWALLNGRQANTACQDDVHGSMLSPTCTKLESLAVSRGLQMKCLGPAERR